MRTIMFRFNNDRQRSYRTQTAIRNAKNGMSVWKQGLTPEAQLHIEKMCENRKALQQIYPDCTFCIATMEDGGVCFEFLEGECYSTQYVNAIKNQISPTLLRKYLIHYFFKFSCFFIYTL